ncbi:hypothetical protein MJO28_017413 [Puccinia striiformis f. sp. tritici]|nr:hypothetical protein MJO28_017413 [Puccinia striiformis f. sp. tritici]
MNNHMFSDKKKSEERNGEYVGYSYPNEWTQSYAKWNGNHHNFLITIRDVYKHDGFVPWLIAHKANVDQIVAENGFLTGFRYDILVRQNAFAFPVPQPDGSQSVADISVLHTDIKDKVYELTRRFDELEYADNPYVYNCQKYNWDPNTGKPKSNKNKAFDNPGSNNGSGGNRGGGYKGRGDWPGRRNEQSAGDYVTANNNQTSWNDHGGDNGWGQKRKADTSAWGSGNGGYRNNDHNRNNNSSASSSQGPPRFNNKKDSSVKGNSAGKDASVNIIVEEFRLSEDAVIPSELSCEMNVEKWREILSKHALLPHFQDVLEGFVSGFDQGIPEHFITGLKFFTPDNHTSSEGARDKIEASIRKELAALRMFGPFSQATMESEFGFFRSNPLGAVVNSDGSVRPINDLSFPRGDVLVPSVNSFVQAEHFKTTWDDFKTVSKFFSEDRRPFELALFDWEKAYRQIPTKREQWKYLLVKDFDGNFLVDTRIAFGGVAGCGSFGRPADAWKLIMKNEFNLVHVFRWVDDNLFVKLKTDSLSMKEVIKLSAELGVMTNEEKGSPFSEEQKFIGFVWNGVAKTVRLPNGKIEQRIGQITPFLKIEEKFSFEQVEILVAEVVDGEASKAAYSSRCTKRLEGMD